MKNLGQRLSEIRKSKKIKQAELAAKLNVSQQVISNIERGVTTPDIELLKKMADIYEYSLDDLVGRNFVGDPTESFDRRVIEYLNKMDEEGKKLSLGLISQVAQQRGGNNE